MLRKCNDLSLPIKCFLSITTTTNTSANSGFNLIRLFMFSLKFSKGLNSYGNPVVNKNKEFEKSLYKLHEFQYMIAVLLYD